MIVAVKNAKMFNNFFQILEPASGEAFIHMTLMKTDNLNINWKEFLDANGTIDVTAI